MFKTDYTNKNIMEKRIFSELIVILCLMIENGFGQNLPPSPCPNLFQYMHDGNEWFGLAELPSGPLGQTTKINVMLSLGAQLPTVMNNPNVFVYFSSFLVYCYYLNF